MPKFTLLLQHYGLLLVFANVLLEQMGLPIPAYPILIVAGALAMLGDFSWQACLLVSVAACLITDLSWHAAGKYFGKRILGLLCRISLSPDNCVSHTEDIFRRWGPKSLLVSKFIPGFNTIAPPLAGAMRTPRGRFLFFSVSGTLLWAGSGLAIGAIFHKSIDKVLDVLSTMGMTALVVIGSLLGLFMLYKYVERRRLMRSLYMARISVNQLRTLIDDGLDPVIVDARSKTAQALEAAIPGAILYGHDDHAATFASVPRDRDIIIYCSCPNEASAAAIARKLINHGFVKVRPLVGGLDAWNAWDVPEDGMVLTAVLPVQV
ncbi:DedA family protein/thiosulfate sulfurtransferase GlpE [Actimicrobium sp. CCC2.4]|uniref:DedA family protein/thiosulfate sulfurtransferase GlpE n=1 Tax=Actimicrobium sp. CCC2.4 TaxID=3048606 RepID=UPI002AC9183C|nr:DedA family protein/thiosulfate sulfurtransferase GlpE [Actimicrobium sp. CCC2.4]MEB0135861.1 DedA family protein/thiosulfate sulfurtransferase GlpE [Actimicrobium sp. CCC2.4]WPX33337.1 DedA family protein/thiosulfate sulfurtransferase GlpE [Actimicrobium sp. CCC2.4]